MGVIYLDTCILIYAVEDDGALGSLARARLRQIGTADLAVSPLVVHESLIIPLRAGDDALIEKHTVLFAGMTMIDLDLSVFVQAAQVRADHPGLKTPDALHLAAARRGGAPSCGRTMRACRRHPPGSPSMSSAAGPPTRLDSSGARDSWSSAA